MYNVDTTYDVDTYSSTETLNSGAAAAIGIGFLIFMIITVIVTYVITAFLLSRIFKKAGVEGWKAWVPFYNNWVMFEIGGQAGWIFLLSIIPVGNLVAMVFSIIAMYNIGLKLQKSSAWVVLAILLPPVWMAILGFDSSKWNDGAGAPRKDKGATPPTSGDSGVPMQPAGAIPPVPPQMQQSQPAPAQPAEPTNPAEPMQPQPAPQAQPSVQQPEVQPGPQPQVEQQTQPSVGSVQPEQPAAPAAEQPTPTQPVASPEQPEHSDVNPGDQQNSNSPQDNPQQ